MKILLFLLTFIFVSCGSYVDSLHREMDGRNAKSKKKDKFSMYRNGKGKNGEEENKVTLTSLAQDPTLNYEPKVKRNYRPLTKRTSARDLVDNDNAGSLWSSELSDGYLFARDAHKKIGDIIVMKVQGKLKNEITAELKRAFPAPKKKKKPEGEPKDPKKKDAKSEEKVAQKEAADEKEDAEESKVYDQVSSVIAEEVNKDYVLIRGQKEVIFRSNKHLVEIQALIPRKDLQEDDTILSSTVLESNITVLR